MKGIGINAFEALSGGATIFQVCGVGWIYSCDDTTKNIFEVIDFFTLNAIFMYRSMEIGTIFLDAISGCF